MAEKTITQFLGTTYQRIYFQAGGALLKLAGSGSTLTEADGTVLNINNNWTIEYQTGQTQPIFVKIIDKTNPSQNIFYFYMSYPTSTYMY